MKCLKAISDNKKKNYIFFFTLRSVESANQPNQTLPPLVNNNKNQIKPKGRIT